MSERPSPAAPPRLHSDQHAAVDDVLVSAPDADSVADLKASRALARYVGFETRDIDAANALKVADECVVADGD